jgi:hypothetical protein
VKGVDGNDDARQRHAERDRAPAVLGDEHRLRLAGEPRLGDPGTEIEQRIGHDSRPNCRPAAPALIECSVMYRPSLRRMNTVAPPPCKDGDPC